MHYIIYKTTNLINGKFYIGKHQTSDLNDGYIGSGKLLKRAIKKYGLDQFKTEILVECPTEAYMNLAEKILVVIDPEVSYNLCPGGKGGFGYVNERGLNWSYEKNRFISKFKQFSIEERKMYSSKGGNVLKSLKKGIFDPEYVYNGSRFKGRKHTAESIEKIREAGKINQTGSKNSQFGKERSDETKQKISQTLKERNRLKPGKRWWNNGVINKMTHENLNYPWKLGRI